MTSFRAPAIRMAWNCTTARLISCDAGIHPGWPNGDSPHAGWVFKIEPA